MKAEVVNVPHVVFKLSVL